MRSEPGARALCFVCRESLTLGSEFHLVIVLRRVRIIPTVKVFIRWGRLRMMVPIPFSTLTITSCASDADDDGREDDNDEALLLTATAGRDLLVSLVVVARYCLLAGILHCVIIITQHT